MKEHSKIYHLPDGIALKQPLGISAVKKEVEIFVRNIPVDRLKQYMDMGTGTGYIAIYLSKKGVRCDAADISGKALDIAKENARINNVGIQFFYSDFFSKIDKKYDYIMFNAPVGTIKSKSSFDFIKSFLRKFEFLRKIFVRIAVGYLIGSRVDINERFIKESLPHIKNGGSLFLLVYKKEIPLLKTRFKNLKFFLKQDKELETVNSNMAIVFVR